LSNVTYNSKLYSILRIILPVAMRRFIDRVIARLERGKALIRLSNLRRRMFANPPRTSGIERFMSYTVRITDGPNFFMQYKDEFVRRIYHFESARPNPLILDCGSNIGISILYFKHVYPQARIIGFEPDPVIFGILQENVSGNKLDSVTLINAALSAQSGTAAFSPDGSAGGHITDRNNLTVRVEQLSAYLNEPVDFLKLNIEGEELPVLLESASSGKLRNVREMVIEYHGWADGQQRLGAILELLDQQGFRYMIHDFDHETSSMTKPPFRFLKNKPWFCLVYACRVEDL